MHLQSKQISEFFLQGLITDCEYSFDRWGKVKKMLSNGGKATGIHIEHFSNALTGDLPPSVLKIQSIAFWRTVKTSVKTSERKWLNGKKNGQYKQPKQSACIYPATPPRLTLTAVQGCKIQTTQITRRMPSLQYVGNPRKTTYRAYWPRWKRLVCPLFTGNNPQPGNWDADWTPPCISVSYVAPTWDWTSSVWIKVDVLQRRAVGFYYRALQWGLNQILIPPSHCNYGKHQ